MNKPKTDGSSTPVDYEFDPEVLAFRQQFDDRSPLDQLVREGARKMLQEAINTEVESFIDKHRYRVDSSGRRLVVKNGSLPARQILTGAGAIEVSQGRVRYRRGWDRIMSRHGTRKPNKHSHLRQFASGCVSGGGGQIGDHSAFLRRKPFSLMKQAEGAVGGLHISITYRSPKSPLEGENSGQGNP